MAKDKFHFPEVEGEKVEMYVDGKWIKGRIVKGYRFRDGVVTMEDKHGARYWCGQDREDLYRPYKKKKKKK